MTPIYDAIIIGAGSIGVPLAMMLAEKNLRVVVIERGPSVGQGQNKAAIGGVRATHSNAAKIKVCQMSLDVFSSWQKKEGDDIHWSKGGYCFPAYTPEIAAKLKELVKVQKGFGLNIDWIGTNDITKLVKGINPEGLLGGTFSPDDGNASPLISIAAFHRKAVSLGVEFRFNETLDSVIIRNGAVYGIKTSRQEYAAPVLVNCAGAYAREAGRLVDVNIPVFPDCHEAGVTEPVKEFFSCMLVDLRRFKGSENFYFYQNRRGHIIFCLTPDPAIVGTDSRSTSEFLPMAAERITAVLPKLRNLKVRRTWRGLYPQTPDGMPIVDEVKGLKGMYLGVGMCGQGFMLGPGVARILTNMVTHDSPVMSPELMASFSLHRNFHGATEKLK